VSTDAPRIVNGHSRPHDARTINDNDDSRMTTQESTDLPIHRGQVWRRAILLGLLCIGLAYLASSDVLHRALIQLLSEIEGVIAARPILGATLFILFAGLSAMFTFVSIAAVVPVAVYAWGPFFSIVLLWIGWILGGICAYTIGRYLGRPMVMWFTSNSAALHRLEARIGRDTPFGLVLLFQLAMPSEIPGYVLGLTRYSLGKYLLSLGIAELPYTIATVVLGASFVERRSGVVLVVGAIVVAMSIGTFYALRKRLSRHQQ
jgi:uncharacterized membrane protein YdjX (TVP38/TMEM64 family)